MSGEDLSSDTTTPLRDCVSTEKEARVDEVAPSLLAASERRSTGLVSEDSRDNEQLLSPSPSPSSPSPVIHVYVAR